jgi:quinol monooxygenase YgiN
MALTARHAEAWRLVDALGALIAPARHDRECVACRLVVTSGPDDGWRLQYIEEWSNEAALQHQVRLARFPQLMNVAERSLTPPEIAFELEHDTRGLDYVDEVRRNVDDS